MKLYYYHTRPIISALEEWKDSKHPGHILYGLTHFEKLGIQTILYPYKKLKYRWQLMIYVLYTVLLEKEPYEVLYGTSYRGLELLIFFRALGLYKKPIAIWHHQSVPISKGFIKPILSKIFYRGIDCMFFFSEKLIEDSLKSGKVSKEKLHLIHWGADIDFYDKIRMKIKVTNKSFISTGKECRDFKTLLEAFAGRKEIINIYAPLMNNDKAYKELFDSYKSFSNIRIHFVDGIIPYDLALKVAASDVVVIPCLDLSYTVGLTTLVEALALGKPIISTNNPKYEMNIEKEKVGILVGYKNVQEWKDAIDYISENPSEVKEMGFRSRKLAEKVYNLDNYAKELSIVLYSLAEKR